MTVVECLGDGRARGRDHGEQTREVIHTALTRWRESTNAHSRRHLAATELLAAVDAAVPDLAEEMHGIAEAAAVPFAEILAYNFVDEQWWVHREHLDFGCSVLGRADTDGVFLTQNMDVPDFMDVSQVVLRLRPQDGPEALVLSSVGMIGSTGVNAADVCVNTLGMLRHNSAGVPVAAVIRGALTYSPRDRAVDFLRRIPHASGSTTRWPMRTVSTASSVPRPQSLPVARQGHRCCTPITRWRTVTSTRTNASSTGGAKHRFPYSLRLPRRIRERCPQPDRRRAASRRPRAPLCVTPRHGRRTQTFGAVAFELGVIPPTARFCLGLPDRQLWIEPGWHTPSQHTERPT
jgi:isopenicillin-N N-acyltransferase-like protein